MTTSTTSDLRVITFDIETRRGPEDVGGWNQLRAGRGGISALIAHDTLENEHLFFDDHTLEGFAALAEQPGVVLAGYNTEGFDLPVIEALLDRSLRVKYRIDLYVYIESALLRERRTRRRGQWKLGQVAMRTMGISKSGDGAKAPDLCAQGRFAELFTYCKADVDLTRQLIDYARRHGGVLDDGGNLLDLDLPEWFRLPQLAPLER